MIEILDGLVSSAATSLLFGTMAKAVALLSAALILVWFCGTRHALWKSILLRAAVVGLLLLPVGAIVLTPIHVPLFSADSGFLQPERENPELLAGPALAGVETPGVPTAADAARVLVMVYGLGLCVMLIRLARSARLAATIRGSTSRITAAHIHRRWRTWKWRFGVRRDLPLAQSARVSTPTQLGFVDPLVVLPADLLAGAPPETLDMVLAHELAHVRGHDCLFRLLSMLARAIYWPIPLAWMVTGQLVKAQEQVCDDRVVKATGDPNGYAGSLLDIASQAHGGPSLALGLEMARAPQVIDRAERVVKTGRAVLVRVNSVVGLIAVFVLAGYISTVAALKPAARMVAPQIESAWHPVQGELAALPVEEELPVRPLAGAGLSLPVAIPPAPVRERKPVRDHSAATNSMLSVAEMAELQISTPVQRRYSPTGPPLSVDLAASPIGDAGYVQPVRIRGMGSGTDWREEMVVNAPRNGNPIGHDRLGVDFLGRAVAQVREGAPRLRVPDDPSKVVIQPLEHQAGH